MDTQHTEEEKIIHSFFTSDGRLKALPAQQKKQLVVLAKLAERFKPGQDYSEKEVNEILRSLHDDYATLRRSLIDFRFLSREGGIYRKARPEN